MLKNGVYNVTGALVRGVITIATVPLLIAALGVDEYGTWSLVFAILSLIVMVEGGLSVATTVSLSQDLAKVDARGLAETLTATVAVALLLATAITGLVWGAAPLVAGLFPSLSADQQQTVVAALSISSLAIWPRLLQQVPLGIEQAFRRFDLMSLLLTLQSLVTNLGMLLIAWRGGRVVALMQWQAVMGGAMLIGHGLVAMYLLRGYAVRLRWNASRSLHVLRFTTSTWLTLIGTTIFSQVDRLLVGALLGVRALGAYAAITSVTTQINAFSALPVQPLLPELSHLAADPVGSERVRHAMRQAVLVNGVVALSAGAVLIVLAPILIPVLIPAASAAEFGPPFQIAAAIYALYSLNAVGYFVLLGLGAVLPCMLIVAASGSAALLLIAVGGMLFGLPGALAGNAGYILSLLLNRSARRRLALEPGLWERWLRLPFIWFGCVSLIGVVAPPEPLLRLTLFGVATLLLVWWFLAQHYESLLVSARRLGVKRK